MSLSNFYASISGMEAQSRAMQSVSMNIANMTTTGYKSNETMFSTLLGSQPAIKTNASGNYGSRSDIYGVSAYERTNILKQGTVASTGNNYDVAINRENAFFMVRDGYDNVYYSRAGNFSTLTEDGVTYMVNSSNMKVQGFEALEEGGFSSSPSHIIMPSTDVIPSVPTSTVSLLANVPASDVNSSSYGITIYGPNNDGQNMNMIFSKVEGNVNTWDVSFNMDGATVSSDPIQVVFGNNGEVLSPQNFDFTVDWSDGSQNVVTMDISKMTQYDGANVVKDLAQDGKSSGNFLKSYIDDDGVLKAAYSNGQTIDVAKLSLVGFTAPENLTAVTGTLFQAGNGTGDSFYVMGYDTADKTIVKAQSLESSNVNPEEEFSRMIQVQRAYSMNTQTFTVNNEMVSTIIDLKS
ncbi:MAG: flagellar hook-basal body complex protein [Alphaproteobacteria bacterium]|nr:flagellar hook-basal body complex protein [Alphaproteobacteria bacterium]